MDRMEENCLLKKVLWYIPIMIYRGLYVVTYLLCSPSISKLLLSSECNLKYYLHECSY